MQVVERENNGRERQILVREDARVSEFVEAMASEASVRPADCRRVAAQLFKLSGPAAVNDAHVSLLVRHYRAQYRSGNSARTVLAVGQALLRWQERCAEVDVAPTRAYDWQSAAVVRAAERVRASSIPPRMATPPPASLPPPPASQPPSAVPSVLPAAVGMHRSHAPAALVPPLTSAPPPAVSLGPSTPPSFDLLPPQVMRALALAVLLLLGLGTVIVVMVRPHFLFDHEGVPVAGTHQSEHLGLSMELPGGWLHAPDLDNDSEKNGWERRVSVFYVGRSPQRFETRLTAIVLTPERGAANATDLRTAGAGEVVGKECETSDDPLGGYRCMGMLQTKGAHYAIAERYFLLEGRIVLLRAEQLGEKGNGMRSEDEEGERIVDNFHLVQGIVDTITTYRAPEDD